MPPFRFTDITKTERISFVDGSTREMSYENVCRNLGFDPKVHFVDITHTGQITYTIGRPDELRSLLKACRRLGYIPSKSLEYDAMTS